MSDILMGFSFMQLLLQMTDTWIIFYGVKLKIGQFMHGIKKALHIHFPFHIKCLNNASAWNKRKL